MRPPGWLAQRGAPGGPSCQRGAATPGPIPNPEVKRPIADSTAVQSVGGQDAAGPSGGLRGFRGASAGAFSCLRNVYRVRSVAFCVTDRTRYLF